MWDNFMLCYFFVYIAFYQITIINSRTSYFKLDKNKIIEQNDDLSLLDEDQIFSIISSTRPLVGSVWSKFPDNSEFSINLIADEQKYNFVHERKNNTQTNSDGQQSSATVMTETTDQYEVLDCGKVNFTYYDDLVGIANRHRYNNTNIPEPLVAEYFLKKSKNGDKSIKNFDIGALEARLRKLKREKPRSVQLYNQIGNFWRIKGNHMHSINCFRRALAISPSNSEVLLNLARVLFNLQYLDDAIHLTRRSLEVNSPDKSSWKQYYTLGEIFKAYGHFQESILHYKHALELFPTHDPIRIALEEIENIPTSTLHVYTVLIIICLVLGVLLVIFSSASPDPNANQNKKTNESETKIPKIRFKVSKVRVLRSRK